MRGFLRVLLFLLIGPVVGLLTVSLAIGLWTLATQGSLRDFTFGWDLLAPGILLISYTVGGFPALLTGIGNIFIARRWAGVLGWVLTALVGGIISLLAAAFLFGPRLADGGGENGQLIVILTLAGAVSGFVCSALLGGLRAVFGGRQVPA